MPGLSALAEEIGGFYKGATVNYRQGLRAAKLYGQGLSGHAMMKAMGHNMGAYFDPMNSSMKRVLLRGAMAAGATYAGYRAAGMISNNTINSNNSFIRNTSRLAGAGLLFYGMNRGMSGLGGAAGRYARQHAWYTAGGVQRTGNLGRMITR